MFNKYLLDTWRPLGGAGSDVIGKSFGVAPHSVVRRNRFSCSVALVFQSVLCEQGVVQFAHGLQ